MQRGGYTKRDAGAIEAVASTGGQLTPPIMGAAAFLMAEFLDISYFTVAGVALLPAALYYVSVFTQVDLIAGRDVVTSAETDILPARAVLREGWHFAVPFGLLLAGLFWWRLDPEQAALLASVAIVVVGLAARLPRQAPRASARSDGCLSTTGESMVNLILVVAAAGFVIGVLNITGLGFALTLVLVDTVGASICRAADRLGAHLHRARHGHADVRRLRAARGPRRAVAGAVGHLADRRQPVHPLFRHDVDDHPAGRARRLRGGDDYRRTIPCAPGSPRCGSAGPPSSSRSCSSRRRNC